VDHRVGHPVEDRWVDDLPRLAADLNYAANAAHVAPDTPSWGDVVAPGRRCGDRLGSQLPVRTHHHADARCARGPPQRQRESESDASSHHQQPRARRPRSRPALATAVLVAALCVLVAASSAAARTTFRDRQAPSTPTSLAVTSATASSVALAWSRSTDNVGVAGYTLFVDGAKVGTTTAVSYTFPGFACGTTHKLGVSSFDAAGNRSATATIAATTAACPSGAAPVNTSAPTITGTVSVGSLLSASVGVWSGSPTSYSYQWQYCSADMSSCADIIGYTSSVYTPVPADAGGRDRVKVTATNAAGSSVAYSSPTAVVAPGVPTLVSAPTIAGQPVVAGTLTASTGAWSGSPTGYAYQWRRCDTLGNNCSAVAGATASSYGLAAGDAGATLRVAVTASNAGGSTTAVSTQTVVVAAAGTGAAADFVADPNLNRHARAVGQVRSRQRSLDRRHLGVVPAGGRHESRHRRGHQRSARAAGEGVPGDGDADLSGVDCVRLGLDVPVQLLQAVSRQQRPGQLDPLPDDAPDRVPADAG
jgi:hypothetical protein